MGELQSARADDDDEEEGNEVADISAMYGRLFLGLAALLFASGRGSCFVR